MIETMACTAENHFPEIRADSGQLGVCCANSLGNRQQATGNIIHIS